MTAWHDDDAFWTEMAPVLFNRQRWEQAVHEVGQIVTLLALPHHARVLDMGCGPGRHALEFARRGFHVTGVDRTAGYLDALRQRAEQESLPMELVQADMRSFRRAGEFDAAVSLLTSFGYFPDPEDDRRVAENLYASLKPGGRLVIELMGKEVLARIYRERDWQELDDGTLCLEERQVEQDWSWINVRWIVVQEDRRFEHRSAHRIYSAAELKDLLAGVGFADIRAFGSLSGTSYDQCAERLIVTASRAPRS